MKTTRRGFIQQTGALTAGLAGSWLSNLAAIGEASAQTSPDDYKALVCIFMLGGNDHANTLVPYDDDSYAIYQAMRSDLCIHKHALMIGVGDSQRALPASITTPLSSLTLPADANGRQFALSPSLAALRKYFYGEGAGLVGKDKLAVLLNVGPLVEPTLGKVDAQGNVKLCKTSDPEQLAMLPPRLESHNDQQSIWQASTPEGATVGWGGKIGDSTAGGNTRPLFTCISASGNAVLLTGDLTIPYVVTPNGPSASISLAALRSPLYGSSACSQALGQIIQTSASNQLIFEQDLIAITRRSISADDLLRTVPLSTSAPELQFFGTQESQVTHLGRQLRRVAHLISKRDTLGAKRQVFFVSLGGFDHHSGLAASHPGLLKQVGDAMAAFQASLDAYGVSDKVTTFTASDFGRTLNSNGDGSDHGWGSMHFVMGGAVKGGQLYGTPPVFRNDTVPVSAGAVVDDRGRGRLIPTTSVDQVAYTLARWMGVPDAAIGQNGFLSNINNFGDAKDLGFMKTA